MPQQDGSKIISDYEHNHVFRGSVNGVWGDEISLIPGEEFIYHIPDYKINENWNPENMHIIAFVYNRNSHEVLQAIEKNLIIKL